MTIDPKAIPAPVAYQILTGAVIPRPIGFISSISAEGVVNLAPFSFFNAVCGQPPMVMFCPMNRNPPKDTLLNVRATGEFVANIVSQEIAEAMNLTAAEYAAEVNEFEVAELTPMPSQMVKPPYVKESPVSMECKVVHIMDLSDKPWGGTIIIGEVVLFHVHDHVISEDLFIDPDKLNPIARMGGPSYSTIKDRFDMIRPAPKYKRVE
jgi:flavin reductase (DIM6/NTAB) family NADH-FMN oxidoreductase RutF